MRCPLTEHLCLKKSRKVCKNTFTYVKQNYRPKAFEACCSVTKLLHDSLMAESQSKNKNTLCLFSL